MSILTLISLLFLLTAICGAINLKYLKLPMTIGIMIAAFIFSIILFISDYFLSFVSGYSFAQKIISQINFPTLLLNGALAFLLFAGSLQISLHELWKARYNIASLTIIGTLLSILFLGLVFWVFFLSIFYSHFFTLVSHPRRYYSPDRSGFSYQYVR